MRRFLKALAISLIILVGVFVVVGLVLPKEYEVERTVVIDAPPQSIHVFVGDLKKWSEWTPWNNEDPTLTILLGDKTAGVGASQSWTGEGGDGELIFTASSPTEGIAYDLLFDNGAFASVAALGYRPLSEQSTEVRWTMTGEIDMPVVGAYFALMMDAMVGQMFEQGLGELKKRVEAGET